MLPSTLTQLSSGRSWRHRLRGGEGEAVRGRRGLSDRCVPGRHDTCCQVYTTPSTPHVADCNTLHGQHKRVSERCVRMPRHTTSRGRSPSPTHPPYPPHTPLPLCPQGSNLEVSHQGGDRPVHTLRARGVNGGGRGGCGGKGGRAEAVACHVLGGRQGGGVQAAAWVHMWACHDHACGPDGMVEDAGAAGRNRAHARGATMQQKGVPHAAVDTTTTTTTAAVPPPHTPPTPPPGACMPAPVSHPPCLR